MTNKSLHKGNSQKGTTGGRYRNAPGNPGRNDIILPSPYQMLYRDWLTLSTQLIWCYDHTVLTASNRESAEHIQDVWHNRAWLLRSGSIKIEQHGQRMKVRPGQWIFLDNTPHKRTIQKDTHILSLAFRATWPDGTSIFTSGLPLIVDAATYPLLEPATKKVAEAMRIPAHAYDIRDQPMDYRTTLQLGRDFHDWLLIFLDVLYDHKIEPTGHFRFDARVIHAVRLLDAHPVGKPLDLKALAHAVGLSLVQLTRLFTADLHLTPRNYFEKRRLEHARRHLILSGTQIKEVAYSLGFHDLSHFSKWFKKRLQLSPRQFVAQCGSHWGSNSHYGLGTT